MNDKDIIKALECCCKKECNTCPCYDDEIECGEMLIGHTIDLINRQKAELERYKGVIKFLENDVLTTKAKAVKEFERKIKAHAYYIDVPKEHRVVDEDDIDAVLKEMTEQSTGCGSSKTEGNG